MSKDKDWRTVCDELIRLGEKASKRPWDSEQHDCAFEGHEVRSAAGESVARWAEVRIYDSCSIYDGLSEPNAAYIAAAANHADRLARFTKSCIDRWKLDAEALSREHCWDNRGGDWRAALDRMIQRLWEESGE